MTLVTIVGVWSQERSDFKRASTKCRFNLARYLSAREFEFNDRSVASTFFDVEPEPGRDCTAASTAGEYPSNGMWPYSMDS